MAIFARRTIQRLISENTAFLDSGQIDRHVTLLNKPDADQALSTEWEVVVLNAFGKEGKVSYEPTLAGSSHPDILFVTEGENIATLADITTLSDSSLHQLNPIDAFIEDFTIALRRRSVPVDRFSCKVMRDSELRSAPKGKRLKLPNRSHFHERILKHKRFFDWLHQVEAESHRAYEIAFEDNDTHVILGYDPSQRYFAYNYPSYRMPAAWELTASRANISGAQIEDLPLYHSLKSKARQLKRASHDGPLAIVLCDGGCHLLSGGSSGTRDVLDKILGHFLDRYSSIAWILVLNVKPIIQQGTQRSWEVHGTRYGRQQGDFIVNDAVFTHFKRIIERIPRPVTDPENARGWLQSENRRIGRSFSGGYEVKYNASGVQEVTVSARALLDVLAGRQHPNSLFGIDDELDQVLSRRYANRFDEAAKSGRLIKAVRFSESEDKDDDLVTIQFGPPDPAVIKFSNPKGKVTERVKSICNALSCAEPHNIRLDCPLACSVYLRLLLWRANRTERFQYLHGVGYGRQARPSIS